MDKKDIRRFLAGLIKKHGQKFSVVMRYKTAANNVRKRHGRFVSLTGDDELILFNEDKGKEGRYHLNHIIEIKKK